MLLLVSRVPTMEQYKLIFSLLTFVFSYADSLNILVSFTHSGKSHYLLYASLFDALAAKGHNLTVIGYYPRKEQNPNFRNVTLYDGSVDHSPEFLSFEQFAGWSQLRLIKSMLLFEDYYQRSCINGHASESLRQFLKEDNHFDLVLMQYFISDCFMGLAQRYNAPLIGKFSMYVFDYVIEI